MSTRTFAEIVIGSAGIIYTMKAGVYFMSTPGSSLSAVLISWGLFTLFSIIGMHGCYKMAASDKAEG